MGQNAWHLNNESSVPSLTSCGACSIEKSTRTSEGDAAPGNNLMDGENVKRPTGDTRLAVLEKVKKTTRKADHRARWAQSD